VPGGFPKVSQTDISFFIIVLSKIGTEHTPKRKYSTNRNKTQNVITSEKDCVTVPLKAGFLPVHQILDDLMVSVPAGEYERCGAVGLGCHQLCHLLLRPMIKKYLKIDLKKYIFELQNYMICELVCKRPGKMVEHDPRWNTEHGFLDLLFLKVIQSPDPDSDSKSGSGSGSRRAKMTHKNTKYNYALAGRPTLYTFRANRQRKCTFL
jgi:hypothetical protein